MIFKLLAPYIYVLGFSVGTTQFRFHAQFQAGNMCFIENERQITLHKTH